MSAGARPRTLPRRRKPSLVARVRPFWIVGLVVMIALAWGGYALANASWFRVQHVGVDVPLASPVSQAQVKDAAAIAADANVWLLRTGAIRRRVEALAYVDVATVHRGQFPQPFVEIGITVRRPAACVRGGQHVVTVDARTRVLQSGCAGQTVAQIDAGAHPLPAPGATIADPDVARLLADAKLLNDANLPLRSLGRDRWGGLEVVDVTGVTVRFGDDADLTKKAALVAPVRAGVGNKRPLRAIDLRAPTTPVVEFR